MDNTVELIIKAIDQATAPLKAIYNSFSGLDKAFKSAGAASKALGEGFGKAIENARNLMDVMGYLKDTAFNIGSIFKTEFIDSSAQFEDFMTVLEVVEGSSKKAEKSMGWISTFAAKTPYELDQVVQSFTTLKDFGIDPMDGFLQTLGDVSSSKTKPIMDAVEAMGAALTGENERLKAFGITAKVEGEKVFYTYTDRLGNQMKKEVDKNNRAMIASTLKAIWDDKYAGGMEKLSKNWSGMMSNVSDQWTRFKLMVMEGGAFDFLKDKLGSSLAYIDKLADSGQLKAWADVIGSKITLGLETIWSWGEKAWYTMTDLWQMIDSIAERLGGWNTILAGIGSFAAVLAGVVSIVAPLGAALSIVAPIVEGFIIAGPHIVAAMSALVGALPAILAIGASVGIITVLMDEWIERSEFSFTGIFQTAWSSFLKIKSVAFSIFNTISEKFNDFIDGFVFGFFDISNSGSNIWGILLDGWNRLIAAGEPLIDVVKDIGSGFASVDWKTVGEAAGAGLGVFGEFLIWLGSETIVSTVEKISTLATGLRDITAITGEFLGYMSVDPGEKFKTGLLELPDTLAGFDGTVGDVFQAINMTIQDFFRFFFDLWYQVPPKIEKIWEDVKTIFKTTVDFWYDAGANIIQSLIDGIESKVSSLTNIMQSITQGIRDFLPFSPAKVGPLSDIHKIQLVETIAQTIKPGPLENAMQGALMPVARPAFAGAGRGNITIHYAPTITVGSGSNSIGDFKKLLREHSYELEKIVSREQSLRERTRY